MKIKKQIKKINSYTSFTESFLLEEVPFHWYIEDLSMKETLFELFFYSTTVFTIRLISNTVW
jgi:hypothetical protein